MSKINAKVIQFTVSHAYHMKREQIMRWIDAQIERTLVSFFAYAFSKRSVQNVVAESITCQTPIGRMLNEHIQGSMSSIDADDICNLGREIERAVDDAMGDREVDVDDIKDLDRAIEHAVTEALENDEWVDSVVDEMIRRLKK